MTISMPDSVNVASLPPGYRAYLGYVDGDFVTAPQLAARFPQARVVALTVTGDTLDADGCDVETGDLTPESGARWARDKLTAAPGSRPVVYASVGLMPEVMAALGAEGVPPGSVRLLSAHFGVGEHICGPGSCGAVSREMDGTQWTDAYRTPSGALVDMSLLANAFFWPLPPSPAAGLLAELGVVRAGDSGAAVRSVQGLLCARAAFAAEQVAIDGIFGPATEEEVKFRQGVAGIPVDGVVGPQTWPVLLGVA